MRCADGDPDGTLQTIKLNTRCSSLASTVTPLNLSDISDQASSHGHTDKASSQEGSSPCGGGKGANDNEAENGKAKFQRRSAVCRRRRKVRRNIVHIDTWTSPAPCVDGKSQCARKENGRKVGATPLGVLARHRGSAVVTLADIGIHYEAPPSPTVAGGTMPACPGNPCLPHVNHLGVTQLTPPGQLAPGLPHSAHHRQVAQRVHLSLLQHIYTHGEGPGPPSIRVSPCKARPGLADAIMSTSPLMEQRSAVADASARAEPSARVPPPERLGSAPAPWEVTERPPQCQALTSWLSAVNRADLAAQLKAAAPESYEE